MKHTIFVGESDFTEFRRAALRSGGTITQSSPVPNGYMVTVTYRDKL